MSIYFLKINQKICEIIREFKLYQKKYKSVWEWVGKNLVIIDKMVGGYNVAVNNGRGMLIRHGL